MSGSRHHRTSPSGDSTSNLPDPGKNRALNVSDTAHGGRADFEGPWIANEVDRRERIDRRRRRCIKGLWGERSSRLEPHLPGLRAELEEQREFRLQQLEELGWAIETFEDEARLEVAYVLAMAAGSALEEIEAALDRLAAGAYGTCVGCAGHVGLERLEVLPMAALCASCQYLAEPVWNAYAAGADRVLSPPAGL